MPFKSKAQQRFMFAAEARGDLKPGTALEFAHATKNIKKLPEHVHKKHAFVEGFNKTAAIAAAAKKAWHDPKILDHLGLATLGAFPAYDIYHGLKKKDKGEVARGALETAGLGLLHRSVMKGH